MRSSFATVPFYREHWALSGRTDPTVVPGRTGVDGGAVAWADIAGRVPDLVPLAGGPMRIDPLRGLRTTLPDHVPIGRRTRVVVLGDGGDDLSGDVIVLGTAKQLARLDPGLAATRVALVPLAERHAAERGLLVDDTLGIIGYTRECGHWHLDDDQVHVRETPIGLACTLLRQHSPRLVDIVPDGADGTIGSCPRHRTPVIV
ncbi:hypothetical protein [Actinokineospora enzanensis]|uniref:hypothetical protein n=1 Tax=Actinokineospora enzanensis TaxID=155975 RepID=UPI0003774902|nr:hypothetical protein [Actinokineospora enzanensis]